MEYDTLGPGPSESFEMPGSYNHASCWQRCRFQSVFDISSSVGGLMRRTGCVLTFVLWAASAWAQDGAALYAQHCGMCHDLGIPRTPTRQVLSVMEPERIVAALETGTMRVQGAQRTA